jgi:peptidoglycan/xylan/chitin deacetylase (PgdA/CDA1 family)
VLSVDFELHWGVFDVQPPDGPYRPNLLGARRAVPAMLDVFAERGVGATWATVGLLMARSRAEAERLRPRVGPAYRDPRLDPYAVPVGEGEDDDPLHYAPSLVARIAAAPGQELATHTFAHVYCAEPGQTREAFAADLAAAHEAARPYGVPLRSIVLPRNQHDPAYDGVLREAGITAYRGNARGWVYRPMRLAQETGMLRAARRLDAYLPLTGAQGWAWSALRPRDGLCNVPASILLRPYLPGSPALNALSLRRAQRAVEAAARGRRVVHLWWHPHNFGVALDANLARLRALLDTFAACRARWGMRSLTMAQAAEAAAAA